MLNLLDKKAINNISEKEFMKLITDYAREHNWKFHHCNDMSRCSGDLDGRYSGRGFADLVMARNGEIIVAELKSENGSISKAQMEWIREYPATEIWRPSMAGYIMERLR